MNSAIAAAGGGANASASFYNMVAHPHNTTFTHGGVGNPSLCNSAATRSVSRSTDAKETDFEFSEILGRGAFSIVCRAFHRPSNTTYALKRLSRWDISHTPFLERCVKWEINVHRQLRHPNIIRLHTYFVTEQELVLVLELCERGTLFRKLKAAREGCFDEARTARYARQVLRALAYLHENNVLHRDLKLENVLLDGEGRVKVADFGLSWQQAEADHGYMTGSPDRRNQNGFQGTLDYLAPEVIASRSYSPKSDIWALGVMIGEMLTGRPLFYNIDEKATLHNILYAEPQLPPNAANVLSPACLDVLAVILQKSPERRPDAPTLLSHPWFQNANSFQISAQNATAFQC